MKNRRIFDVENALSALLSKATARPLIRHLRANKAIASAVCDRERDDLKPPPVVTAYNRELRELGNELNAMQPAQRAATLAQIRAKHQGSLEAAIAWQKKSEEMLEDDTEIRFVPAPADLVFDGDTLTIDPSLFTLLSDVGIFLEEP